LLNVRAGVGAIEVAQAGKLKKLTGLDRGSFSFNFGSDSSDSTDSNDAADSTDSNDAADSADDTDLTDAANTAAAPTTPEPS
jgi:hypothetical protein